MLNRTQALIILLVQVIVVAIGFKYLGVPQTMNDMIGASFAGVCFFGYWILGARFKAFGRPARVIQNETVIQPTKAAITE